MRVGARWSSKRLLSIILNQPKRNDGQAHLGLDSRSCTRDHSLTYGEAQQACHIWSPRGHPMLRSPCSSFGPAFDILALELGI